MAGAIKPKLSPRMLAATPGCVSCRLPGRVRFPNPLRYHPARNQEDLDVALAWPAGIEKQIHMENEIVREVSRRRILTGDVGAVS